MTDQQLTELLIHPRVVALIERIAEEKAIQVLATLPGTTTPKPVVKVALAGDMNYTNAAAFIGCPKNSIRSYVCTRKLDKGALPHTVTLASVLRFRRNYTPKPHKRIPR
jgi:hypothetical protein